jgi:hypothetical protein
MTIHDTPPTGVAVLSFQITVTGATLNPVVQSLGAVTNGPVAVIQAPIDVELTQLVTDSGFLGTVSVPEGTYQNITLTFANPRLTMQNNSGAAIGSCANGAICELSPALSQASAIYPFSVGASPVTLPLSPGSTTGLDIDFNLAQSIQSDLSILPAVTVTQLPKSVGPQGQQFFAELDNLEGAVSGVNFVDRFTLNRNNGQNLTLFVNNNDTTAFGFTPDSGGLNDGETLRTNARLQLDGTVVATQVYMQQTADQAKARSEIVGIISSVDSPTQFHMVMHDGFPPISGIQVGNLVSVTIQGAAAFDVASDGLTLPSGVSFASPSDLMIGQEVQVSIAGSATPTDITTDQIRLRMSQITGTVSATGFTLSNLPSLFTNSGITAIQGAVVPETTLQNLTSISLFQTVAVRGPLFNTAGAPTLIADKVAQQQPGSM